MDLTAVTSLGMVPGASAPRHVLNTNIGESAGHVEQAERRQSRARAMQPLRRRFCSVNRVRRWPRGCREPPAGEFQQEDGGSERGAAPVCFPLLQIRPESQVAADGLGRG